MFLWIIQWIIISVLLISLIHYLYSFFENILVVPKMKDMVNPKRMKPTSDKHLSEIPIPNIPVDNLVPPPLPSNPSNEMELELEEFLQNITKPKTI